MNLALLAGRPGNSGERRPSLECGDIELLERLLARSSSTTRGGTPSWRESSCSSGEVAGEALWPPRGLVLISNVTQLVENDWQSLTRS